MEAQAKHDRPEPHDEPKGPIEIHLVNEDDGREYDVHAGRGVKVSKVIEEAYKKLGVQRAPGDRLRCEGTGEDVFPHADTKVSDYVEDQCSDRVWLFAGDTGGA